MNSPVRILIVEDEAILAEDLRVSLERQSYQVIDAVDNAADALDRVARQQPNLVMMDIHLADGDDGIDVARRIRDLSDVPVIFLTAHSDPATLDRAKTTTPYGYLVKPFEERELRAAIETALYRHQADAQLRKMERWLRTTLHSIGDGVITVDLDRRITFINPIAETITGWTRQAALGLPYEDVFALRGADNRRIADPLSAVLREGTSLRLDEAYQIDNRDGHRLRIDDSIAPIRDADGKVAGAIIIFRDATEKWELEQLRRKHEKRLQEAQRLESLGVLAAGIAHDFNNLLAIIMGHAELIGDSDRLGIDERDSLTQVREAAKRASHLCDQMLSYAESDGVQRQPFDLKSLLDQTAKLLPPRVAPGIQVRVQHATDHTLVRGHSGRLQQLFSNLVHNAIEAMEEHPGLLEITTAECAQLPDFVRIPPPAQSAHPPHGWLRIGIEDQGHGMSANTLERIFDPFFTTKFTGRGLGLSIVFKAINLHEGALAVRTAPGLGTRFDIYLPITEKPAIAPPPIPTPENWQPKTTGHVLVVDDEENVRQVLRGHLRRYGFTVSDTDQADQALAILGEQPDTLVVFLDLTMPDITGVEVLERIRLTHRELPVIFVSGFSEDAIASVLTADRHTSFIQKPFTRAELSSALMQVVK